MRDYSSWKLETTLVKLSADEIIFDSVNYTKIKTIIANHDRAQIITSWNKCLNNILKELEQMIDIRNESTIKKLMGKILVNICHADSSDKMELLVIMDDAKQDSDFASVIEMRFIQRHKKNYSLLVLNNTFLDFITCSANANYQFMINKFSILHHWSIEHLEENPHEAKHIVDFVSTAILRMPKVETIVLRGCCSASEAGYQPTVKERSCQIVSPHSDILSLDVNDKQFLFQQVVDRELKTCKTLLKFRDIHNKISVIELMNIPINASGNKLSYDVQYALALLAKEYNLPPLSLPSLQKLNLDIRSAWLRNNDISVTNKKIIKSSKANTRTYLVDCLPVHSLAGMLDQRLLNLGINVTIKGYTSLYVAYPNTGVMLDSSHGYRSAPKALKKLRK